MIDMSDTSKPRKAKVVLECVKQQVEKEAKSLSNRFFLGGDLLEKRTRCIITSTNLI